MISKIVLSQPTLTLKHFSGEIGDGGLCQGCCIQLLGLSPVLGTEPETRWELKPSPALLATPGALVSGCIRERNRGF